MRVARNTRRKLVGWRWRRGETPLDPSDLEEARAAVRAVDRRHPLALAHFANHPPKGIAPNVHVASVDVVFDARDGDEGQSGQSTASLRPYLPNVGLGRWPVPLGADEAVRRQAARTEQGKGFGGALSRMFGEKEDTETAGKGDSNDDEKIVVPTLVLVADWADRGRGGVPELPAQHAREEAGLVPPGGRRGGREAVGDGLS